METGREAGRITFSKMYVVSPTDVNQNETVKKLERIAEKAIEKKSGSKCADSALAGLIAEAIDYYDR